MLQMIPIKTAIYSSFIVAFGGSVKLPQPLIVRAITIVIKLMGVIFFGVIVAAAVKALTRAAMRKEGEMSISRNELYMLIKKAVDEALKEWSPECCATSQEILTIVNYLKDQINKLIESKGVTRGDM